MHSGFLNYQVLESFQTIDGSMESHLCVPIWCLRKSLNLLQTSEVCGSAFVQLVTIAKKLNSHPFSKSLKFEVDYYDEPLVRFLDKLD